MSDQLMINGQWLKGEGDHFDVIDPCNGVKIDTIYSASVMQIDDAVNTASNAFDSWHNLPVDERIKMLEKYAFELKDNHLAIQHSIAHETGKPQWEAATEVTAMINKINISIDAYWQRTGYTEKQLGDKQSIIEHRAHGVLAVLGPFNFPAHLPNGHIVPAILAGNTIVLKPSEYTPLTAMMIMGCWHQAGLPDGVINLIQGRADVGSYLSTHPSIAGTLFTGSYNTGKKLSELYAGYPEKILALEMGGNNPLVVWDVKDIDAVIRTIILSAYITAGQRCTCARRLIIADDQSGQKLITALLSALENIRVAANTEQPEAFMGPVISKQSANGLLQIQTQLKQQGATILKPMTLLQENTGLLSPGLIDITNIKAKQDKEYFGPLLQVIRVKDFDAAIKEANNTQYGLSAGLLSDDINLFNQFKQKIRAGLINFNCQITGASSDAPFGGIGHSGNHRPSAYYAADYCAYPVASMQRQKVLSEKIIGYNNE